MSSETLWFIDTAVVLIAAAAVVVAVVEENEDEEKEEEKKKMKNRAAIEPCIGLVIDDLANFFRHFF